MKNIAVIGCGSIGKRHAENLIALGCKVWAYDPALDTYWCGKNNINICQSAEIAMHRAEAVVIASPSRCHYDDIIAALAMKRHIFVEKPVLLNDQKIIFEKRKEVFMVGHMLRFHPAVFDFESGKKDNLGTPIWAQFTVAQKSEKDAYLKNGVTINWAIHEIDLALYLLGPAEVECATGGHMMVDFVLRHKNGCRSSFHADYYTNPEVRDFRIIGEKGFYWADLRKSNWDDIYKHEIASFLNLCNEINVHNKIATYEDGYAACQIAWEVERMIGVCP